MEPPRHLRLIRRRRDGLGYTLVEVIVAMLISCIMVTAMFSVALTQKQGSGKSDRRMLANQGAAQITAMLKGYVTGCGCDPTTGACSAVNGDCTLLPGPNTANSGVATWYMNGGGITDSMGNVYALTFGSHVLQGVLPAWLEAAPYNARVTYVVSAAQGLVNGRPVPQVVVTVNWTEP
jgi:prepilin-type N-terminal cleavage/methylation domain-containing protein